MSHYSLNSIFLLSTFIIALESCYVKGSREKRIESEKEGFYDATNCSGSTAVNWKEQEEFLKVIKSGSPSAGGILKIHSDVEPPHLQPMLRPDAWIVRIVQGDVFEPLVARNRFTGEMEGVLADRWQYNPLTQTYTFHLRNNVKWHDGKSFTSKDVIFTFNLLMDPMTEAITMRESMEEVDEWKANGPFEVILHVRRPNFLFLQNLEGVPILPQHLYGKGEFNNHPLNRAPVGTGPFRFKRWEQGKKIVLVKNTSYWGRKPWLDEVDYVFHRDRNVAFELLKKGEIDLMPRADISQFFDYEKDSLLKKNFYRLAFQTPDFSFIMLNTSSKFFSDVRVRKAMAHLIDLEKILASVYKCLGTIVTGPWPVGHPAYDNSIKPYSFDPTKAKELLESAGWKDHDNDGIIDKNGIKFRFTFIIPVQSREVQRMATIYQQDLKNIGIQMDIALQDWSVYLDLCKKHKFEMAAMMWDMEWENDLYGLFHTKSIDGGQNFPSWSNDEADEILEKGRGELNDKLRNEMFRKLHRILHDDVPYIFTFSPVEVFYISKEFRGEGLIAGINWFDKTRIWKLPYSRR